MIDKNQAENKVIISKSEDKNTVLPTAPFSDGGCFGEASQEELNEPKSDFGKVPEKK